MDTKRMEPINFAAAVKLLAESALDLAEERKGDRIYQAGNPIEPEHVWRYIGRMLDEVADEVFALVGAEEQSRVTPGIPGSKE